MSEDRIPIAELAARLEECELQARDTLRITLEHPELNIEDAYAIQEEIRRRKVARGSRIIGFKAGLTSRAKMRQMGVEVPVFGFLADYFAVPEGSEVRLESLIHPKVEPEIAFVMKRALRGPDCDVAEALGATDFIIPAMEVIDSRYRDFKFDLPSVVADNCSSCRIVLGSRPARPASLDLRTAGVVLEKNGQPTAFGAGAAVMGHPAAAVASLANFLAARGAQIPAGAVILSGGITEAVSAASGDSFAVRVQDVGSVSVRFV